MRTLLLFETLFVTLLLLLGRVSGAEELKHPLGNMMTLKTAYFAPLNKPVRPTDLLLEAQHRPTRSVLATASLLQGHLVSEGEVAYSSPDPRFADTGLDSRSRLLRFALTGTHGGL
ncbi:MAG: hypothetical protein ACREIK_05015, partial [Nitrospiraceae bacterium]